MEIRLRVESEDANGQQGDPAELEGRRPGEIALQQRAEEGEGSA